MIGFVVAIDKPVEWTSHDAVQRLRSILGVREIGHAGTLDPFATGALVCGVGRGTKVISYLADLPKEYRGVILLGRTTDTGDITGETIEERPVDRIDLERLREIAASFVGRVEQIPPVISAIKLQGRRLYDLAREGVEVELRPRLIEIHEFEILGVRGERVEFRVRCGKGTYIRALARDLGERLDLGGCVESLRRTAVGGFGADGLVGIEGERAAVREGLLARAIPLGEALRHLAQLRLRPEWVRRVRHGEQPPWRAVTADRLPEGPKVALVGAEGDVIAMARIEPVPGPIDRAWQSSWELKLERVL